MAKKQIKHSEQKTIKQKGKLSLQKIVIAVLAIALIGFFIVNNFLDKEPKVEYYPFTKEGELTFTDSLGTLKAKLEIEIADNDYERQLGLMNRNEMKDGEGMLFVFPEQERLSFWMRNTLISLDMIFVNDRKQIVTIHKNTKILADESYPSSRFML